MTQPEASAQLPSGQGAALPEMPSVVLSGHLWEWMAAAAGCFLDVLAVILQCRKKTGDNSVCDSGRGRRRRSQHSGCESVHPETELQKAAAVFASNCRLQTLVPASHPGNQDMKAREGQKQPISLHGVVPDLQQGSCSLPWWVVQG